MDIVRLPAHRVALLGALPSETDIRLHWDLDTGWASVATAGPTAIGQPRFLGFAQLITGAGEHEPAVTHVLSALRSAGFTVLADRDTVHRLRETRIRHRIAHRTTHGDENLAGDVGDRACAVGCR